MVNLTQGRHILTFVCTGKRPAVGELQVRVLTMLVLEQFEEEPANANDVSDTSFDGTAEHGIVYRGRTIDHYLKKRGRRRRIPTRSRAFYQLGEFGPDGAAAVPLLRTDCETNRQMFVRPPQLHWAKSAWLTRRRFKH